MKKEEFPTFLNEQPTVVFGRTTRELLVILVGLTGAYLVWTNIGALMPGPDIGVMIIKGLFATVPLIGSLSWPLSKLPRALWKSGLLLEYSIS